MFPPYFNLQNSQQWHVEKDNKRKPLKWPTTNIEKGNNDTGKVTRWQLEKERQESSWQDIITIFELNRIVSNTKILQLMPIASWGKNNPGKADKDKERWDYKRNSINSKHYRLWLLLLYNTLEITGQ